MKLKFLLATLALFFIAALLAVGNHYGFFPVPGSALGTVRWLAIAALFG